MTDAGYTHIHIVADRSGSMHGAADGEFTKAQRSTEGIRQLVRDQQAAPGRATFSLTDFDTRRRVIESFGDGSMILSWQCQPRDGTALYDALGSAIDECGTALAAMDEDDRPGRVIFVVATDGLENASREYSRDTLKTMVTGQQDKYGWDFVYIGADIDAFAASSDIGVAGAMTLSTSAGTSRSAYTATSSAILRSRYTGQSVSYTDEERGSAL